MSLNSIYAPDTEWETFLFCIQETNGEVQPLMPFKTKLITRTNEEVPCKIKPFRKSFMENENTLKEQRFAVFEFKLLLKRA